MTDKVLRKQTFNFGFIRKENRTLAFAKEEWCNKNFFVCVIARISRLPFLISELYFAVISHRNQLFRRIGSFFFSAVSSLLFTLCVMLLNERNIRGENELCCDIPTLRRCILMSHVTLLDNPGSAWNCGLERRGTWDTLIGEYFEIV